MGGNQQGANQTMSHRSTPGMSRTSETKHTEALGSITISVQHEKSWVLSRRSSGLRPLLALPSTFLVSRRIYIPFPYIISSGNASTKPSMCLGIRIHEYHTHTHPRHTHTQLKINQIKKKMKKKCRFTINQSFCSRIELMLIPWLFVSRYL